MSSCHKIPFFVNNAINSHLIHSKFWESNTSFIRLILITWRFLRNIIDPLEAEICTRIFSEINIFIAVGKIYALISSEESDELYIEIIYVYFTPSHLKNQCIYEAWIMYSLPLPHWKTIGNSNICGTPFIKRGLDHFNATPA